MGRVGSVHKQGHTRVHGKSSELPGAAALRWTASSLCSAHHRLLLGGEQHVDAGLVAAVAAQRECAAPDAVHRLRLRPRRHARAFHECPTAGTWSASGCLSGRPLCLSGRHARCSSRLSGSSRGFPVLFSTEHPPRVTSPWLVHQLGAPRARAPSRRPRTLQGRLAESCLTTEDLIISGDGEEGGACGRLEGGAAPQGSLQPAASCLRWAACSASPR